MFLIGEMNFLTDLQTHGWARVAHVSNRAALLELAESFGVPIASPTGELVKEVRVTLASEARVGTLSATHGVGGFPLHTDTAFWPVPARYVLLRVHGDTRRPTKILPFEELFANLDGPQPALAKDSLWLVRTYSGSFYSPLTIQGQLGWRYDEACMFPANCAAKLLQQILKPMTTTPDAVTIDWSGDEAIVLSNWRVLHGRGLAPEDEKDRILERIYVR